jgi:hypothetical protein
MMPMLVVIGPLYTVNKELYSLLKQSTSIVVPLHQCDGESTRIQGAGTPGEPVIHFVRGVLLRPW